ncbi:MAG: superoxide dismutase [Bacteroidota bacterium]
MENNNYNRRKFLLDSTKASLAVGVGLSSAGSFLQGCGPTKKGLSNLANLWAPGYEQAPLPYAWNALEPSIDKETMNIHYSKHAAAYAKSVKEAMTAENVDSATTSITQLLGNISKYTPKMRNNAGGHYNHELFWQLMKPGGDKTPGGSLLAAINKDFGSLEAFKTKFEDAGKTRFGSGWAWLIKNGDGKLQVASTANQDNPLMDISEIKGAPLLALDVWEHAYYLKYQNKRPEYITNWWNVVNWTVVESRFSAVG